MAGKEASFPAINILRKSSSILFAYVAAAHCGAAPNDLGAAAPGAAAPRTGAHIHDLGGAYGRRLGAYDWCGIDNWSGAYNRLHHNRLDHNSRAGDNCRSRNSAGRGDNALGAGDATYQHNSQQYQQHRLLHKQTLLSKGFLCPPTANAPSATPYPRGNDSSRLRIQLLLAKAQCFIKSQPARWWPHPTSSGGIS